MRYNTSYTGGFVSVLYKRKLKVNIIDTEYKAARVFASFPHINTIATSCR